MKSIAAHLENVLVLAVIYGTSGTNETNLDTNGTRGTNGTKYNMCWHNQLKWHKFSGTNGTNGTNRKMPAHFFVGTKNAVNSRSISTDQSFCPPFPRFRFPFQKKPTLNMQGHN